MAASCPVQTPADRQRSDIVLRVEADLLAKVLAALKDADETATAALRSTGLADVLSLEGFFTASVHQKLYCRLCGADPTTFAGGNAATAVAIIRNSQQIAKHHWGADIEPLAQPAAP